MSADVTVFVASCNTRAATELCVRTLRRLAGYPFGLVVGDAGSTDGSRELLEALAARGWLALDRANAPRSHADWLDRWLASCETEYAVFVDSDVEFRREGWLRALVARAERSGAAMVCAELLPEQRDFVEPVDGKRVRLAARPAPWLVLVACEPLRRLATSFAFAAEPTDDVAEGFVAYDVGARLFHDLCAGGLTWTTMPRAFRRAYRHYGGLSWLPLEGRRGRKKQRDLRRVERRLDHVRRRDDGGPLGALARRVAASPPVRGKAAAGRVLQRLLAPGARSLLVTARMRDGSVLRLDLASPTERPPAWSGRYEPELMRLVLDHLPQGARVVDVGANVGLWSVPLGRRITDLGGRLDAFEPVAANHARLRENLALNGLNDAVRTFRLALGERTGTVELRLEDGAPTGNAVAYPPGHADRVDGVAPLDTLDAVAEREAIDRCDLLKLDVEGGELGVLRGARRFLRAHRPVVLAELNPYWMRRFGWDSADVVRLAGELGYAVRPLPGHVLLTPETRS